ncbi:MAG: transposase [Acidobacteriaceae bacterium]|nr:transposase [Acidobacteriaceae bacterium]
MFYRRRLPHWIPEDAIIFITWRLAGSVPVQPPEIITIDYLSGKRESPLATSGPFWLRDPRIAILVAGALHYGEATRRFYDLYAWVIMPNHMHVILKPHVELSSILRWLKGRTGRMANRLLGRIGMPFWQDESFDHWVRSNYELTALIKYVESNPVHAGLVQLAAEWPWSSVVGQTIGVGGLP